MSTHADQRTQKYLCLYKEDVLFRFKSIDRIPHFKQLLK